VPELGFGRDGLDNMRIDLALIAVRVGACVLFAHFGEEEFVVSCPFRAIHATPRCGDKLRVSFIEGRKFEDEEDVALDPELETADRKQDTLCLLPTRAPIFFEASGESLFLLTGLELRQQERMTDADLLAGEGFDHKRR
jgi:hypothetical protein